MNNTCVRKYDCPKPKKQYIYWDCPGKYEEYKIGENQCKDTCEFHMGLIQCVEDRCVPGCFCAKGFARNKKTGTCIPIEDCPKTEILQMYEYHF